MKTGERIKELAKAAGRDSAPDNRPVVGIIDSYPTLPLLDLDIKQIEETAARTNPAPNSGWMQPGSLGDAGQEYLQHVSQASCRDAVVVRQDDERTPPTVLILHLLTQKRVLIPLPAVFD